MLAAFDSIMQSNSLSVLFHHIHTQSMTKLAQTAKNVTRDLNPNDDLKNLRIKTSRKELVVSHDKDFIVIVVQEWTPAKEESSHIQQPVV